MRVEIMRKMSRKIPRKSSTPRVDRVQRFSRSQQRGCKWPGV